MSGQIPKLRTHKTRGLFKGLFSKQAQSQVPDVLMPSKQRPKGRRWSLGKIFLLNSAFCTVFAVILWLVAPGTVRYGFTSYWVHSLAIGTLICALVVLTNCAISRFSFLPKNLLLFVMPLIIATGFYLGTDIARMIVGGPSVATDFNSNRQMLIAMIALTVAVTVVINSFFTTQIAISELKTSAAEESERAAQAQLTMLLAQIEPHMLFNTLANLRALIATDPVKANEMLDRLIEFLRTTLRHSRIENVTLEHEFQLLENYLCLMDIRLGERLQYSLALPEGLRNCSVPSLLLQPIVENAIKHGIEPSAKGGHISINAVDAAGKLRIIIEDTGAGIGIVSDKNHNRDQYASLSKSALPEESEGLGVANVRARCHALEGGKFSIQSPLSDEVSGTRVHIELPKVFQPSLNLSRPPTA